MTKASDEAKAKLERDEAARRKRLAELGAARVGFIGELLTGYLARRRRRKAAEPVDEPPKEPTE